MKIRMVIPECRNFYGGYCKEAENFDLRVEILKQAMDDNSVNLIVTSHNFFVFHPHCLIEPPCFIGENILNKLNGNDFDNIRKPLVLGFDLLTSNIKFNPYEKGIDAIVCFLDVVEEKYKHVTHIWECWEGDSDCSKSCFIEQNKNRVFKLSNKSFGLLSCGDIAGYCHSYGEILPEVDIYLNLSHKSLKGHTSQNHIPSKILSWKEAQLILGTQQVKNTGRYLNNKYPYIFPADKLNNLSLNVSIEKYESDDKAKGVFVDLELNI
jgi:hypothetical protein